MPLFLPTLLIASRPFISSIAFPVLSGFHTLLLSLALALLLFKADKRGIRRFAVPAFLSLLCLGASAALAPGAWQSLSRMYIYPAGFLLFFLGATLSARERDTVFLALVIGGIVISVLALYQFAAGFSRLQQYLNSMTNPPPFAVDFIRTRRIFLPFITPDILGGYLAMILPLSLNGKRGMLPSLLMAAALLLTRSVGAIASLFCGLLLFYALTDTLGTRRKILLGGILAAAVVIIFMRMACGPQHTTLLNSAAMRFDYWRETAQIIRQHPLTGAGTANFNLSHSRFAHNSYLQILAETGILGFLPLALFVSSAISACLKNRRHASKSETAALAAVIIFMIHNMVDFSFFLPESAFVWWLLLGTAAASPDRRSDASPTP